MCGWLTRSWWWVVVRFPVTDVLHVDIKLFTLKSLNQQAFNLISSFAVLQATHLPSSRLGSPSSSIGKSHWTVLMSIILYNPVFCSWTVDFMTQTNSQVLLRCFLQTWDMWFYSWDISFLEHQFQLTSGCFQLFISQIFMIKQLCLNVIVTDLKLILKRRDDRYINWIVINLPHDPTL